MSPGERIKHHDMVGCLTLTRIQNCKRVATTRSFDIVFTAEDSDKSYLRKNVVYKEPDGIWLIA